jgi:hypothetical protein
MTTYALGTLMQALMRPIYEKTPHMSLMMDWPMIVGSEIGAYTWPVKIVSPKNGPGVAYIQSHPSHAIQAWSASVVIIERINQYLGYQAVNRIRLMKQQGAEAPEV